jgi:signal transduction histidine kinase
VSAEKWWHRFSGPDSLNQTVFFTVLFVLTSNRFLTLLATQPEGFLPITVAIAPGTVATWVIYTACAAITNRVFPQLSVGRAALVVLTFVATGVGREILLIVLPGIPIRATFEPSVRIFTALFLSIVMFPVVAALISDVRQYRRSLAEVKTTKRQLQDAIAWSNSALENDRQKLVEGIGRRLRKVFKPLADRTAKSSTGARERIARLEDLTKSVLQPLSKRLADDVARYRTPDSQFPTTRVRFSKVIDTATQTNPFRPGLYIWGSIVVDAPVFLFVLTWPERFWALGSLSAFGLVNIFAQKMLVPILEKSSLQSRIVVTGSVYIVSLLPISVFMFVFLGGTTSALWVGAFSIVFGFLFLVASASKHGFGMERRRLLDEFYETKKRLEWRIARINSEVWVEQRHLAMFLHGEIQSLIQLAQMKIHRAIEKPETLDSVVREVSALLRTIPSQIEKPFRSTRVDDLHEELRDRWGTFITLNFDVTDESRLAIDRDPIASRVCKEIVSEFILNSVKHGNASSVSVALSAQNSRLEMTLSSSRNNTSVDTHSDRDSKAAEKRVHPQPARVGLGSQLFDSVIVDRRETETASEFTLTGAVPMATLPAAPLLLTNV